MENGELKMENYKRDASKILNFPFSLLHYIYFVFFDKRFFFSTFIKLSIKQERFYQKLVGTFLFLFLFLV